MIKWSEITSIVAFGDSYSTVSANLHNYSPSLQNPVAVPKEWPIYGHTSAGGPNWIYNLATSRTGDPILTYDFAVGGATVDSNFVPPFRSDIRSLNQQFDDDFVPVLTKVSETTWSPKNALFTFFFGINDINLTCKRPNLAYVDEYTKLIKLYMTQVEKAYKVGMRHVLFMDIPPIDRSPLALHDGPKTALKLKNAVETYNALLFQAVQAFRISHPDVAVRWFSTYQLFTSILDQPEKNGIKEAETYCIRYDTDTPADMKTEPCPYPIAQYFWINGLHPTWRVHQIMAVEVLKTLIQ